MGGLGFKIPLKALIIQAFIASLILLLTNTPFIPRVQAQEGETWVILEVDGYAYEQHQGQPNWVYTGASPYLNALDNPVNIMSEAGTTVLSSGNYTFENLPSGAENVTSIILWQWADNDGSGNSEMASNYHFWNGTHWDDPWYDQKILMHESLPYHWNTTDVLANNFIQATTTMVNGLAFYVQFATPFTGTPACKIDYVFLNVTVDIPPPPPPPQDFVGDYFGTGIFIGGIIMMIFAPSWVAWKVKKVGVTPNSVERAGYAMLIFLLGLGLFLSYIYGGV